MKVNVNKEYMMRHLLVAALMLGLSGWFGFDGFVRYPATDAAALYEAIEGAPPAPGMPEAELARFKAQKIRFQRMFALALLLVGGVVGVRLGRSMRFSLAYDADGFTVNGVRHAYADVKALDDGEWEKKGIARVVLADRRIVLDAWHHVGIKEFYEKLKSTVDSSAKI
ncbi:MAG: hypothetical protein ACI4R9_03010 [Kiritimatiellia bacterium]